MLELPFNPPVQQIHLPEFNNINVFIKHINHKNINNTIIIRYYALY